MIVRQFAWGNSGMLAGDDRTLDTTNTGNGSEMKTEAEEMILHRLANGHYFLEMWHSSQNLCATKKESRPKNMQMTAVEYISDTDEIVKASWSCFQHAGASAFKMSQRSPLPPALSPKGLPGGRTWILNDRRIRSINSHPVGSDEDSAPERISDTEHWLDWNGYLDNPNESRGDWAADFGSDVEPEDGIEDPECPVQRDGAAVRNVPGLIWPTWELNCQAETVMVTVNAM